MPFDQTDYQPTDPVLKCLQDARQWLSDPKRWLKKGLLQDAEGNELLDPRHVARGVRGCARGAICRFNYSVARLDAFDVLDRLVPKQFASAPEFNDDPTTTHADILGLFDRAIEARRAELLAQQSAS